MPQHALVIPEAMSHSVSSCGQDFQALKGLGCVYVPEGSLQGQPRQMVVEGRWAGQRAAVRDDKGLSGGKNVAVAAATWGCRGWGREGAEVASDPDASV